MEINYKRIYRDIIIKLSKENKSQVILSKELQMGRSTIWRLSKNKEISTSNFFKIIEWLGKGIEHYLIGYINPIKK